VRAAGGLTGRLAAALLAAIIWSWAAVAGEVAELPVLGRVGPWPHLSKPIAYGGRLWLVNSVLGVNHNSADLYSVDPARGDWRFERRLFSQDAGNPTVHEDLLYWPSEDPRVSVGWGDLMVTDGRDWAYHVVPTARIFHVHAMAAFDGALYAATSAWRAGLQVSRDRGATWETVYDHATPDGRVSRIVGLVAAGSHLYAHLIDQGRHEILAFDGSSAISVLALDSGRIRAVIPWQGGAVVLADVDGRARLWRLDRTRANPMAASGLPDDAVDIATNGPDLFAVGRSGAVAAAGAGLEWRPIARVEDGSPGELIAIGHDVYVTGTGDDSRGILWGPDRPAAIPAAEAPSPLPSRPIRQFFRAPDWEEERRSLETILAADATYDAPGTLRNALWELVLSGAPADLYEAALDAVKADRTVALIGGNTEIDAASLADWMIVWAMAAADRGIVPPTLLAADWRSPDNRAEKYFDLPPIAAWAVAQREQGDSRTIGALVARLGQDGDPDWLTGDIAGALSRLTGERFGYDVGAWRAWWREKPTK